MTPISVAAIDPQVGDAVHAMSHPAGVEFAWVYASGSVRQRGLLTLAEGEKPGRTNATLYQLPAQSGSPGGPILNDRGELIGVLSARESAQHVGYSASPSEIAGFLDAAIATHPAKNLSSLFSRVGAFGERTATAFATALAFHALERPTEERERIFHLALAIDPHAYSPRNFLRNLLVKSGRMEEAEAEVERGIRANGTDRPLWLGLRASRRIFRKEWRGARSDLEEILDVYPRSPDARRRLIGVLLELNKDDEAAAAVGDLVRADPARLPELAADLLEQVEAMEQKFPATPSLPANWLKRAIGAAQKSATDPKRKAECEVVLKAAEGAKSDAERLAILREFLTKLSSKTGE